MFGPEQEAAAPTGLNDNLENSKRRIADRNLASEGRAHTRLRQIFRAVSGASTPSTPSSIESGLDDKLKDSERERSIFLDQVDSYSRLMYKHTISQMSRRQAKTLPNYTKSMQAFTMYQMEQLATTKSETSNPHAGARQAMLPSKIETAELGSLKIDDAPVPPANSPDVNVRDSVMQQTKPRRTTEPALHTEAVMSESPVK